MKIRVINPNTTASMTATIEAGAKAAAAPGTVIEAATNSMGPASIEGNYDEALAVPGVIRAVADGVAAGADGFVIACFGDPGMDAAREVAAGRPVVGIAQAGFHMASLVGRGFAVVTTLGRTVGRAWDLVNLYGFERSCKEIAACEVPVLGLDDVAEQRVGDLAAELLTQEGIDAIVLGCAGMATMCTRLTERLGSPVIDGVGAGTALVEGMVRCGIHGANTGEYAPPLPKQYTGLLEEFTVPEH